MRSPAFDARGTATLNNQHAIFVETERTEPTTLRLVALAEFRQRSPGFPSSETVEFVLNLT